MIFCIFIMVLGVVGFSFVTGSVTSIISNLDHSNAIQTDKLNILKKLYKDYQLPLDLYLEVKKNIELCQTADQLQIQTFIEEQPHKLRIMLSMYIHEARYKKLKYLNNKTKSFISWFCPLLKPDMFSIN